MSEYLGSRISLISKSDIRYVGTLHQINSEDSTVSLENVKSFGTEGRKPRPEEQIPPSDQVYDYIVFRGSDVKDLRIEESPPAKENKPPAVPNDPAILGARPRPDAAQGPGGPGSGQAVGGAPSAPSGPGGPGGPGGPAGPGALGGPGGPGFGHPNQFNNFYPPPPGNWGRGGPAPGPGFGNMAYPPPPGWYPPGQGFPPGPGAPGPWNYQFLHGGPASGPAISGQDQNKNRAPSTGPAGQDQQQRSTSAAAEKQRPGPSVAPHPNEPKPVSQGSFQAQSAPTPPVDSKPSIDQVKAASSSAVTNGQKAGASEAKPMPTGPKNNRIAPAIPTVPRPFQVPATIAGSQSSSKPSAAAPSAASIQDATEAAKAAVAIAMAKIEGGGNNANAAGQAQAASQAQNSAPMDNLTKKVQEMRVNAARTGQQPRGRGRGGRGGHTKVEVPDADFDFASSNAKFNKEDLVKEAVAGSPLTESQNAPVSVPEELQPELPEDTPQAYNKSKSFFDNISSEAKDRAGSGGQKPGGREWRGEEQRKNMETFGQGSVDGGYRNYRGRGRGRGNRGRGYHNRGGRGSYRNRENQPTAPTNQ